nr:helix-turn-helix transcriptional regulator [Lysinibacillus sp. BW-2-10]
MSSLGELLRQLRAEESLRSAAKRIGISFSYLALLESDMDPRTNRPPKPAPDVLQKIAKAYKCDYMQLVQASGYGNDPEYNGDLSVPFPNNPKLQQWYQQLPSYCEEDVEKLMTMWNLIQSNKEIKE